MLPTRKLGKNGPVLTEIGFGAWAIGGPWKFGWGYQDDRESIEAIETALDSGVNWIDTAAAYGLGHSEEVVGKAVKGKRDRIFIATKCGITWDAEQRVQNFIGPESIKYEVEQSLKRLKTDYIDLYQIHWPDRKTPEEKAWEVMISLKEQGKIRYAGVSNFDVPKMEKCLALGEIYSLQPIYNLVRRKNEKEVLPFCKEHGIGVVAYSPMASGLLTGKINPSKFASDDWRKNSPYFREPFLSKASEFLSKLASIADKYGKTVGQLAVAWVLNNSAVTSAIVGARNAAQAKEIAGGAGWKIGKEDLDAMEAFSGKIFGDQVFSDLSK